MLTCRSLPRPTRSTVVDAATGHAAEHPEPVPVGVKSHGSAADRRARVRQLDMRHLKLCALAAHNGIVLAPVELECLARAERQRNEGPAARGLLLALSLPATPRKSRHPAIGAGEAERHQIGVQLLQRSPLLARLPGLGLQPARQLLGKRIKLAGSSIVSALKYFVTVLRDNPVRRRSRGSTASRAVPSVG